MGGPGPNASTHVYDCHVTSVKTDGVLYLGDFTSRNPPPKAIHWRTTKRLAPPNLVGIVRLQAGGSTLADSDSIKWGEVVYHGDYRNEERRRQNGELAVNMFSIIENDLDYFTEGCKIAVIDCMCFVPEWIPVLKALEAQKQARLPFDDGRYLNLRRDQPVICGAPTMQISESNSISASDRAKLVGSVVFHSSLEPIREIRGDSSLAEELASRLENLVKRTTLDKMQLVSFVESLKNPVHTTQVSGDGPTDFGMPSLATLLVSSRLTLVPDALQTSITTGAAWHWEELLGCRSREGSARG
jgi:hypothetical protein